MIKDSAWGGDGEGQGDLLFEDEESDDLVGAEEEENAGDYYGTDQDYLLDGC